MRRLLVRRGGAAGTCRASGQGEAQAQHADTQDEQLDKAFLDALQQKAVPVKSRQTAIDLAHSTCDLLHRGGTVNDALLHVKNATSWSVDQITAFAGVAVYAYCRDQTPK